MTLRLGRHEFGDDATLMMAIVNAGDTAALATVDPDLARELWATVEPIRQLVAQSDISAAQVDHDAAPFGVQYWVMRWTCES